MEGMVTLSQIPTRYEQVSYKSPEELVQTDKRFRTNGEALDLVYFLMSCKD